jgi:hypothetical protein
MPVAQSLFCVSGCPDIEVHHHLKEIGNGKIIPSLQVALFWGLANGAQMFEGYQY